MRTERSSNWITQKEASELSGRTIKAVHELTRKGRLRTREMYGKRLVRREDVLNYEPKKAGRPKKVLQRKNNG